MTGGRIWRRPTALTMTAMIVLTCVMIPACSPSPSRRPRPWSAASLGVPRPGQPWKLMTRARGVPVTLRIPQDLPLLETYPAPVRAAIRARIQLRDRNVAILNNLAQEVERLLKEGDFSSVPQQDRGMQEIVLGIDQADVVNGDPLFKHEDILRNLPPYTHVELFVPDELARAAARRLRELAILNRVTVNPVKIWIKEWEDISITHTCSAWTQDMFRVGLDTGGKEYLFTPASFEQADDLGQPDFDFLLNLIGGRRNRAIVRLPIFFHAGNIELGVNRKRTLFVGRKALDLNAKLFFTAVQALPSEQSMLDLLQATSGADEVIVLRNSSNLFHLDMAMIMLDRGVVGLIEPLDSENLQPDDRAVLVGLRSALTSLGYRIVPIPTVTRRMAAYQSPVNIVMFVDRTTSRRTAFVPEFPDEQVTVQGRSMSLNRMVLGSYETAGIRVIPLADRFSSKRGDIHCVLKVID